MRYHVTTPNGEQGPYEEEVIRGWLRAGTMPADAPVRAENESTATPASIVFPGTAAAAPSPGFGPAQPPFGASPGGASPNMYAPPIETAGSDGWVHMNQGSFWQGFLLGFFCGCVGLIISYVSSSMGSETKRGVRIGFGVQFGVGLLFRLMALAAR